MVKNELLYIKKYMNFFFSWGIQFQPACTKWIGKHLIWIILNLLLNKTITLLKSIKDIYQNLSSKRKTTLIEVVSFSLLICAFYGINLIWARQLKLLLPFYFSGVIYKGYLSFQCSSWDILTHVTETSFNSFVGKVI